MFEKYLERVYNEVYVTKYQIHDFDIYSDDMESGRRGKTTKRYFVQFPSTDKWGMTANEYSGEIILKSGREDLENIDYIEWDENLAPDDEEGIIDFLDRHLDYVLRS